MEYKGISGFNPCFNGCLSLTPKEVLKERRKELGFNPCFNGCLSLTRWYLYDKDGERSFNPCFNGCLSLTLLGVQVELIRFGVSILVLMDVFL